MRVHRGLLLASLAVVSACRPAAEAPATSVLLAGAGLDLPAAVDDSFVVTEDVVTQDMDVLGNDTGLGDTPLAVFIETPPSHGYADTLVGVRYVGFQDYYGPDSFQYRVTDADGDSSVATVTLDVLPVDEGVSCNDIFYFDLTIDEDEPFTMDVSTRCNAPDFPLTLTVEYDGSGTVTTGTSGSSVFQYTPAPNLGNTTDSFGIRVTDRDGQSDVLDVAFFIQPVDDVPVANDDAFSVEEDSVGNPLAVIANDELGDGSFITEVTAGPQHGVTETDGPSIVYTPDRDFFGTDVLEYRTYDNDFQPSGTATVEITVTPVNDVPEAAPDGAHVAPGETVLIAVLANDRAIGDGGLVVTLESTPANGVAVATTANTIRYTAPAGAGTETFSYRVTDVEGDYGIATVKAITHPAFEDRVSPVSQTITEGEAGSFQGTVTLRGSGKPTRAAWDFDDDGTDDTVVCDEDGGTAAPPCALAISGDLFDGESAFATGYFDVALADLDGDGALDAITAGETAVHRGDGLGGFRGAEPVGFVSRRLAVADVTGDGELDLVALEPTDGLGMDFLDNDGDSEVDEPFEGRPTALVVWSGDGAGSFTAEIRRVDLGDGTEFGGDSWGVAAGDLDADGDADIAVTRTTFSGETILLRSDPAELALMAQLDTFVPIGVALHDSDDDGDLDVFVMDAADSALYVYENDGAGAFSISGYRQLQTLGSRFAFGDLDADGDDDVVIGAPTDIFIPGGVFSIPLSTSLVTMEGGMPFSESVIPEVGGGLAVGELDGLPGVEVVGRHSSGSLAVREGSGGTTIHHRLAASNGAEGIALADLDGDGNLDVLALGLNGVNVLRGDGAGNLGAKRLFGRAENGIPGDFDGDGALDLLSPYPFSIRFGDGARGFVDARNIAFDRAGVAAADFDGDGDLDIASSFADQVQFWENDGSASFTMSQQELTNASGNVHTGDLDGDGSPDVILEAGFLLFPFLNDGSGTFIAEAPFAMESGGFDFEMADVNGDALADVVITTQVDRFDPILEFPRTAAVVIVNLRVPGGFVPVDVLMAFDEQYLAVRAADLDGDGGNDIAALRVGGIDTVLANGTGGFLPPITTPKGSEYEFALALGDLDGDGIADLATGGDSIATVRLGDGTGRFGGASRAGLTQHARPLIADLDGDGANELVYPGVKTAVLVPSAVRWTLDVSATTSGFSDPGDYVARLTVEAESAGPFELTRDIEVTEAFPMPGVVFAEGSAIEREATTLHVDVTVSSADALTSCVWDFGDGTPLETDLSCAGLSGLVAVTREHVFADGDPTDYVVTVELHDEDGFSTATGTITVENGAPVVSLTAPVVVEGVPALFSAAITDSDDANWRGDWYRLTPAPTPLATDVSPVPLLQRSFTFAEQATAQLYQITVSDQSDAVGILGGSSLDGTDSVSFDVLDHEPQIGGFDSTANPYPEAQLLAVGAVVTAVPEDPIASCSWNFGDGTGDFPDAACVPGSTSASPAATHVFADGDPTQYTITLSVTDEDGTVSASFVQTIANSAPSIAIDSISPSPIANEGSVVTATVTIADDAGNLDRFFRLDWSWGDGTTESTVVAGIGSHARGHAYADQGSYPVGVTVTDQTDAVGNTSPGSLSGTDSGTAVIGNVPPLLASIPSPQSATEGQVFLVQAFSSDPGADPPVFSLTAAPSGMTVLAASGVIAWSPSYLQSGPAPGAPHTVTVQVADGDGSVDTETFTVNVVWKDDDADGMADTWELANGLDPTENDASEDADGDGVSNLDEFLADTPSGARTPGAVGLVSPADGASVTTPNPSFTLTNAIDLDGGPLTYRVQIASDSGFTNVLVTGSGAEGAGTSMVTASGASLTDDATYFWRARAIDPGALAGPWSAGRSFFYSPVNDAPSAPGVVSPAGGSQVSTLAPTLVVAGANDPDDLETALTFRFRVWDDAALTDPPVADSGVVAASPGGVQVWPVDVTLADDTQYWWTVTVTDPATASSETLPATFRVNLGNSEPGAPVAVSPLNAASVTSAPALTVTNAIDADGDALEYLFEIDSSPAFNSPDYESSGWIPEGATQTAFTPQSTLVENRVYQWRARATDGAAAGDVASGSFRLDATNDAPTAAVLLSPVDGETLIGSDIANVTFANGADPEEGALDFTIAIFEGDEPGAAADAVFTDSGAVTPGAAFTSRSIEAGIKFKGHYVVVVTHTDPQGTASAAAIAHVTVKSGSAGGGGGGGCSVAGTRSAGAGVLLLPMLGMWAAWRRRRFAA